MSAQIFKSPLSPQGAREIIGHRGREVPFDNDIRERKHVAVWVAEDQLRILVVRRLSRRLVFNIFIRAAPDGSTLEIEPPAWSVAAWGPPAATASFLLVALSVLRFEDSTINVREWLGPAALLQLVTTVGWRVHANEIALSRKWILALLALLKATAWTPPAARAEPYR